MKLYMNLTLSDINDAIRMWTKQERGFDIDNITFKIGYASTSDGEVPQLLGAEVMRELIP